MGKKTFEYVTVRELRVLGDRSKRHKVVELGYYIVDGKTNEDKIYIWDYYFNRDGELVRAQKATVGITIDLLDQIRDLTID